MGTDRVGVPGDCGAIHCPEHRGAVKPFAAWSAAFPSTAFRASGRVPPRRGRAGRLGTIRG